MPKAAFQDSRIARGLYAQGRSVAQIAEDLHVSANTIYRCRSADKKAGRAWDQRRESRDIWDQRDVIACIGDRIREALADDSLSAGGRADTVQKYTSARKTIAESDADGTMFILVGERASEWGRGKLPDEDLSVWRRLWAAFLSDIGREP